MTEIYLFSGSTTAHVFTVPKPNTTVVSASFSTSIIRDLGPTALPAPPDCSVIFITADGCSRKVLSMDSPKLITMDTHLPSYGYIGADGDIYFSEDCLRGVRVFKLEEGRVYRETIPSLALDKPIKRIIEV